MKKRLVLGLLITALSLSVTACGGQVQEATRDLVEKEALIENSEAEISENIATEEIEAKVNSDVDNEKDNEKDNEAIESSLSGEEETTEMNELVVREIPEGELVVSTVKPDEAHMKFLGRAMYEGDSDSLWMTFSGTGAEFEFYGTKAVVHFLGDSSSVGHFKDAEPRVAVYVNGERSADVLLDEKEVSVEACSLDAPQWNTVRIVKLSECANSTCGIASIEVNAVGDINPTAKKQYMVEIIGDSITCGYGVDDEDKDHHFVTGTEDVTKSYSYLTAEALDVDYSMVSFSGYGIASGWTDSGEINTIATLPQYYKKMGFSYQQYMDKSPQDFDWDFARKPDVVVINLGTNDASYTKKDKEKQAEYKEKYVEFLKEVRECNPQATIVCTLGIMGDELYESMVEAMNTYKDETGDENIYNYKFQTQLASDGYVADWHPSAVTHRKAAEKLVGKIASILEQ